MTDFDFDDFAASLESGAEGVTVEGPRRKRVKKVKDQTEPESDKVLDLDELKSSLTTTFEFFGDLSHRAWNTDPLTADESARLAGAWTPVLDKYLHEWLKQNSVWIPVLVVTPPIVGKRALQAYVHTHKQAAEDGAESGVQVMDPDEF